MIVPLPDEKGRANILGVHLRNTPMASTEAKVLPRDPLNSEQIAALAVLKALLKFLELELRGASCCTAWQL